MTGSKVVLLVERDRQLAARFASWFEDSGTTVMTCPGPTGPDYSCVGFRTGACPLAGPADVVVLDLWLESDSALTGVYSHDLLECYVESGKAVVALDHDRRQRRSLPSGRVVRLEWPPERRELLETVSVLLRASETS